MMFEKEFPSLKGKSINAKPFGNVYTQYVIQEFCLDCERVKKAIQKIRRCSKQCRFPDQQDAYCLALKDLSEELGLK